jgi:hypothetical protein
MLTCVGAAERMGWLMIVAVACSAMVQIASIGVVILADTRTRPVFPGGRVGSTCGSRWRSLRQALSCSSRAQVSTLMRPGIPNMVDNSFLNDHICGVGTSRICP